MRLTGEFLKNQRIKKKLPISVISNELNISISTLIDVENDHFEDYIDSVYMIGHIRSYAKFLSLNESMIVENFKLQISFGKINSNKEISKPILSSKKIYINKYISFASVLIISSSFYFLFFKGNNLNENNYAMTPEVPENLSQSLEKTEMEMLILDASNKEVLRYIENEKIPDNYNDITSNSSAIASLRDKNIKSINGQITLKLLSSSWVQLRDSNDKIIISKLMNKGDEYSYDINSNLSLTAGNAGNIVIFLDGIVMGKAGKAGQVLDSLIIDKNFNN
jgi:cytoskeletal protein RodZ